MEVTHRWRPIEDYEVDPATLASTELRSLTVVWQEQRERIEATGALPGFHERLAREWAIETGLIEWAYQFDRGTAESLIERGIVASLIPRGAGPLPEVAASRIRGHEAALHFLFSMVENEWPLDTSRIEQLQVLLTPTQRPAGGRDSLGRRVEIPPEPGVYREQSDNPARRGGRLHEYCPPEQVASELDRLVELHRRHREVAPEVEAAWLHHCVTRIQPFRNGNGRVARALATLVLIEAGRFPLVVRSSGRNEYLDALGPADGGDLRPLVEFFAAIQRREFVRALGLSRTLDGAVSVAAWIRARKHELRQGSGAAPREWETVRDRAGSLRRVAERRLLVVKAALEADLAPLAEGVRASVDSAEDHGDRSRFFRRQVVEGARSLGYRADFDTHRAWARLVLRNTCRCQILFSFHGIGREFRGVLVCSALFFESVRTGDEDRETSRARSLADSPFQINYEEDPASIEDRFREWIEGCIVEGLRLWRRADL